jgi:hypothetical protein
MAQSINHLWRCELTASVCVYKRRPAGIGRRTCTLVAAGIIRSKGGHRVMCGEIRDGIEGREAIGAGNVRRAC